jgi:hypothetical protein
MNQERAQQIVKQARAHAGCGPWSDQLDKIMTSAERDEVIAHWQTMPGHTCFVDALNRFANGRVEQPDHKEPTP